MKKNNKYTSDLFEWIIKHYNQPRKKTIKEVYENFGIVLTNKKLDAIVYRIRKSNQLDYIGKRYDDAFFKWLSKNYYGTRDDVLKRIEDEFGYNITKNRLKCIVADARKYYYIPPLEKPKREGKPCGYIRKRKNGNVEIKVYDFDSPPHFIPYYRYMYENARGKIPKNKIIVFVDGNNMNQTIENMHSITRYQDAYIKSNHFVWKNIDELETLCLLADLAQIKPHYIRPSRRKVKNENQR